MIAALACAVFAACADGEAPAALGDRCRASAPSACAPGLVCLDGLCRERPDAASPDELPLPPLATFDIVETALEPDSEPPDTAPAEVHDTRPDVERLVLGAFDAAHPSELRLSLVVGQAAVREVLVPINSRPELARVTLWRPGAEPSCGRYRPVLWAPRALLPEGGATFGVFPDLVGEPLALRLADGAATPFELPFPSAPPPAGELGRAPYRVGVRYEGPCPDTAATPHVLIDTAGPVPDTFVWSETFVPAAELSLPGRFAVALQIAIDIPP